MSICIHYHPEAYTTGGPKLMGRNAAGESFLKGFLMYARTDRWWVQVQQREHVKAFAATARAHGRQEPVYGITMQTPAHLSQPGALYLPGPGLAQAAFDRAIAGAPHGAAAWSLFGVTHTTASAGVMDELAAYAASEVRPWDTLVCTSLAVKANVVHILEAQEARLAERLGATRFARPMLPVIPLGIHTADFANFQANKLQAREALGIDPEAVVVMFMGRLSFHAKAHPLAMYQAVEAAAKASARKLVVLECGWYANEYIEQSFLQSSRWACPSVAMQMVDGRVADKRALAWASADIFCSLSDNIQESFGLTPIEAMAVGLPSVVSDWDGYKDTVRHGVDGYRIPTSMPPPGSGAELAQRHALGVDTYDRYCGNTSSFVAVDVQAATQALLALINDPALRHTMGQAAQHRARTEFDWKTVMARYEDVWHEQAQRRRSAVSSPSSWPARPDPFTAFAAYPSRVLSPDCRVALSHCNAAQASLRLQQVRGLAMVSFADSALPPVPRLQALLEAMQLREHGQEREEERVAVSLSDLALRLGWDVTELMQPVACLLKWNILKLDDGYVGLD